MRQPITTLDLFNGVKTLTGKDSAYAVGKYLQVDPDTAGNWAKGKATMGDQAAVKAAAALGLDPEYVLACMHLEREKNAELRKVWERIVLVTTRAAVLVLAVIAPPFFLG
ncbi:MAG: hypothetical protein Q8J78_08915 [Moraxellaceae bacterium]|nr:hypothetical protein [Moraxellaceae bacterium]